jgi:hypothetical protein
MALQIANPEVVGKIERLAALLGRTEQDTIESAIDRFLENVQAQPHAASAKPAVKTAIPSDIFEAARGKADVKWRTDELMALLRSPD